MSISDIGAGAKGEYHGPGWPEWLLGLAATALGATQISHLLASVPLQSAESYYLKRGGVVPLHIGSAIVDLLAVFAVAGWIFAWKRSRLWSLMLSAVCFVGTVLVWLELYLATGREVFQVYILPDLPFRPVGNMGLLGATVYLGYLTMRMPTGSMKLAVGVLVKLGIWMGLFGVQWVIFDRMVALRG